jgi:hypothetical protein
MIKSPLTSPLRPALTSPYELITRSVFELNGTQWGELSKLIVLNSSFELEWKSQWPQGDSGGYFFANNNGSNGQSDRFVMSSDKKIFGAGFNGTQVIETAFADQSIHAFRLVSVLGGDVTFYVDNTIVASAPALFPVNINSIGDQYDSATSVTNYAGIFYDLKVWTNGDRNTGDLILNVPFDESGSDYQRNRAVPLGVNLADSEPSNIRETWADNGDGSFTALSNGEYLAVEWSGVVAGKVYKISYDIVHHSDGGIRVINGSVSEPWNISTVDGRRDVYVTADSTSLGFRHDNDANFTISDVSIREWSGVILQTALPEDWMRIEKKRRWDYWLGVENVFSADVVAGFWQALPGNVYTIDGTQTSNNDITTDSAMTVGGTFIFTGLGENIVGTFAFRAGPNEILIIESAGFFEAELTAEIVDIVLRAQPGASGTFSKLSVRRKLEIAS